ncbi:MAG: hypothetical protein R3C39_12700 [Dehalococcoidia bacterium]
MPIPIAVVGEDLTGDGEVDQRDQKRALVLAPYFWQFSQWDESDHLAERLESIPAYEGNVTVHVNRTQGDRNVTVQDWLSFEDYDAIFISTHGARECNVQPDGMEWCYAVVSTGLELNLIDLNATLYKGFELVGPFENESSNAVISLGFTKYTAKKWYPNGLDNTLLSLSACETGLIPGDELAAAVAGEQFVLMAWTEVVPSDLAFKALGTFVEQLSLGASSELAYQAVIEAGFGSDGALAVWVIQFLSAKSAERRNHSRQRRGATSPTFVQSDGIGQRSSGVGGGTISSAVGPQL